MGFGNDQTHRCPAAKGLQSSGSRRRVAFYWRYVPSPCLYVRLPVSLAQQHDTSIILSYSDVRVVF